MHSSKAIQKLQEGNYYDRITGHLRHGDKCPLNKEDKVIFERIERTQSLWLFHKDDRMVINVIKKEFVISQAQAYNYLYDAKSIYQLFFSFNPMTELLLLKERINKAFELAEKDPKSYGKLYAAALLALSDWIKDMRYEQERNKPDERKKFVFIYHNDWRKIPGVTEEILNAWEREFDELEEKARKRFSHINAEDVEFTESK